MQNPEPKISASLMAVKHYNFEQAWKREPAESKQKKLTLPTALTVTHGEVCFALYSPRDAH